MSDSSTNNRHIACAVQQGAPSPVLSQAGVVKNATGAVTTRPCPPGCYLKRRPRTYVSLVRT